MLKRPHNKIAQFALVSAALLILAGCAVGPDYKKPDMELAARWKELPSAEQKAIADSKVWWKSFNDQVLDNLVERTLKENNDLKIAESRIREARAQRQSTASSLYPQVNASAQAQRGNLGLSTQNKTLNLYEEGFDASWEIDLFGGNRRKTEASDALVGATTAGLQITKQALISEVVREYMTLRELQSRFAMIQEMADNQKRLLEFTQTKLYHGAASIVDLSQTQTLYQTSLAKLPEFEKEITASIYRISVLTGSENDSIVEQLKPSGTIPTIAVAPALDAPAAVISRRPDIIQAEKVLHASTALTGAAMSDLYPKISLSGFFGWQNTSLLPSQQVWNIGSGIAMPMLNFGRIQGSIDVANERQQQAYYDYRQTVIAAMADVETRLSAYSKTKSTTAALESAMKNSEKAYKAIESRNVKGTASQPQVLMAKNSLLQMRDAYLGALAEEMRTVAALQKALGF